MIVTNTNIRGIQTQSSTSAHSSQRQPTMSTACDDHCETADTSCLPDGSYDLTVANQTECADERPSLEEGTIVTKDESHDSDEFDAAPENEDGEHYLDERDDDRISHCYDNGVPTHVKVSFSNDNDDLCDHDDSDSEPSDAESDEELDADSEEDEEVDDDESVDHDSADEYETDEDSVDSERSDVSSDDLMDDSSCGLPSRTNVHGSYPGDDSSQHELFLPSDVSPSTQLLKYEDDDKSSDDEEESAPHFFHRRYIIGNGRSGRPRMWDGCPSSISVSSDSSSSSEDSCDSRKSSSSSKRKKASKAGVSFSDSVTVYPVFETAAYTPSMVQNMYTKRDELRVNKLRNKREYAYDLHDWRNATEEEEMEPDHETGELIHPVHNQDKRPAVPCRTRNVVQTYSSALGGYTIGSVSSSSVVHRAKRMRMYYP